MVIRQTQDCVIVTRARFLLVIPEILLLIEQIGPRTTKIDNLGTTVTILF